VFSLFVSEYSRFQHLALRGQNLLVSHSFLTREAHNFVHKTYKKVRKEEEDRKKRKEESKGRQERKKDFVSKFFPKYENSPGGKPYLQGILRNMASSTLGAVGKTSEKGTVVSNFLNSNIFKTKVKTSTLNYGDRGQSIENLANPEMTPAADRRKVGNVGEGAHLDPRD
jgi:hypothetical protein